MSDSTLSSPSQHDDSAAFRSPAPQRSPTARRQQIRKEETNENEVAILSTAEEQGAQPAEGLAQILDGINDSHVRK
jgi:hypothetical protein